MTSEELKSWFKNTIKNNNEHVSPNAREFYLKTISEDFKFTANGEICDFDAWYKRYENFKQNAQSLTVNFDEVIAENNVVAASYWVDCVRKDGSQLKCKIIGIFRVRNNKIDLCDELFWIEEQLS